MSRNVFEIAACALLVLMSPVLGATAATITQGTDTYVRESAPNRSSGTRNRVEWDSSDGGGENHALIHFDIFQDEGGLINAASVAQFSNLRAYLKIEVVDNGDPGNFHRLTTSFDNSTTWNDLGGGIQLGVNAIATSDVTTDSMRDGTHYIDVTASILAWASTPGTNMGWAILPTDTDGLEFSSFNSGSAPELIIGNATDYITRGPSGSTWSYYDSIPAPPAGGSDEYPIEGNGTEWTDLNFDDSGWATGTGEFGFGDGDETTIISSSALTSLFRTSFMVLKQADELWVELLRDDSAVVYLNGVEVIRDNLPASLLDPSIPASSTGDENDIDWFRIDESLLLVGQLNILAVEIHNASLTSSDISFDLGLVAFNPIPLNAIPEPGTGVLVALGLTVLAAMRRKSGRERASGVATRAMLE